MEVAVADSLQPVRSKIMALEKAMLDQPQVEIPVEHTFHGGMCARTIRIPKGTILTGAIHTQEQMNIVDGDISILTEDGQIHRFTGHHVVPSPAGTKRVGVAHEDTSWTTILRTDAKTVEEVEALVTKSFDDPRLPANKILELEA
jgi:hypothetical protein